MSRRRIGALLAVLIALAFCTAAGAAQPSQGKHGQAQGPQVGARSWALIDGRTGEVLATHAGEERLPIGPAARLMTAYVAIKDLPLDERVRDLLRGLILRGDAAAANTLAIEAAGSVKKFVAQMNRHAAALGLTDTHYANPVGPDESGNYSSALDLATLTEELERIPAFAKIADAREAVLGGGNVLVTSGRRNGVRLIAVAIDPSTDETRSSGNRELLEWGFRQYPRHRSLRKGQELASASIRYSGGELPLLAARSLTVGSRPGQKVAVEVDAPHEVTGPIRRGAPLGTATVSVDGLRAGSVALVASRPVPAASSFEKVRGFVEENPVTLAITACAILIAAMLLGRYVRRIRRGKRVQQK